MKRLWHWLICFKRYDYHIDRHSQWKVCRQCGIKLSAGKGYEDV